VTWPCTGKLPHRPILLGGFYRPPSTCKITDSILESNIEHACLRNQETILVGDFNIDYLDKNTYKSQQLTKGLRSLNFTQMVDEITRPKSKTCLDHVYSTHPDRI
jgi:hypothetical protein